MKEAALLARISDRRVWALTIRGVWTRTIYLDGSAVYHWRDIRVPSILWKIFA